MYDETDPTKWQQDKVCLDGEMKNKYENAVAEKIVEDLQPKQNHNVNSAPEKETPVRRKRVSKYSHNTIKKQPVMRIGTQQDIANLPAVVPRRQRSKEGEMKDKYENAVMEKVVEDLHPNQTCNVNSAPENKIPERRKLVPGQYKINNQPVKRIGTQQEIDNRSVVVPRRRSKVKQKVERIETKMDEGIAEKVKNALKGGTVSLNTDGNSIRIWDFGGQPIYHSILRFFLTPEGIFIIVFKLTDDLNAFTVIEDSNGKTRKYYMTNLQHLLYWIRSSYTYSSRSTRDHVLQLDLPACIIAGTHRNSLGDTEEERERKVKQQFDLIRNAIKGKVYESHVYPTYFDVENQLSSSDKNIGKMKEVILKIKNRMKRTIPIKWFEFLMKLQEISAENITLPLEEVKSKARECGIKDDKTIDLAIAYFSDVGEIMHHPMDEALRDTVVLQPMRLVDYVRTVFTVMKPELRDATLQNEWRDLEKGVLRKSLLKHLWRNFPVFSDDKDEKMLNFFIALMKKFGLICQRKTPQIIGTDNSIFYAFSHIQPDPEKRVMIDDQGPDRVSIFHDFCGFLPDFVFQEAVTRFIEAFLVENANPELAYEYVELDIDAQHRVSLAVATIKHRRMFKTTILRRQLSDATDVTEPEPETCKKVLTFLQSVFDALCQTRERMQYKTCIPCGCSDNFQHMQIIKDFNNDAIPCGSVSWSIKRYCHLFGDSNEATVTRSQPDQRPLEDVELLSICNSLDKDWKELALHLKLTRPELDYIESDNNQVKDAMMAMLVKWRDRQPPDINQMQVMCDALKQAGYVRIAGELMGKSHSAVLHDNDLLSVREGLGTNWARFAVCLGFNWQETQLLRAEHHNSDLNACMDMLTKWKKRQSSEINQVNVMCGLLEVQGFLAVADQLRRVVHSEGFLDDTAFALISENICADWDKVAVKLGIGWHSIEAFRKECCGREFKASMDMLTTWRIRQSSDINQLNVMCEILNGMGRNDVVEQLRKKYAS
ncbi:uncharacterized protein LOC117123528 isoform X2 [Anneissia japonica]|uniref:uncharacterized protein LOC117123528 isoform X2 n=1 Tax=Anneissia japonica TaxID=1529436 RepID=UPI001425912A|nr:uncharacterized protein LOC117123528 isoform X2 [Anneissia japonica]